MSKISVLSGPLLFLPSLSPCRSVCCAALNPYTHTARDLLCLASLATLASHFRFASLKWFTEPADNSTGTSITTIKLKVHLAYRRSGVNGFRWLRNGDNNNLGDQVRTAHVWRASDREIGGTGRVRDRGQGGGGWWWATADRACPVLFSRPPHTPHTPRSLTVLQLLCPDLLGRLLLDGLRARGSADGDKVRFGEREETTTRRNWSTGTRMATAGAAAQARQDRQPARTLRVGRRRRCRRRRRRERGEDANANAVRPRGYVAAGAVTTVPRDDRPCRRQDGRRRRRGALGRKGPGLAVVAEGHPDVVLGLSDLGAGPPPRPLPKIRNNQRRRPAHPYGGCCLT